MKPTRITLLEKSADVFVACSFASFILSAPASANTLYVPADAPPWAQIGAALLLYGHIGGGLVGLLSGTAALFTRKGDWLHRVAGNVFFISMLIMAGIGATVSPFLPDRISAIAGVLTFYLVASSWATVVRREGTTGRFEVGAFFAVLGVCAAAAFLWMRARTPEGTIDGLPAETLFLFMTVGAIAAVFDLKVILRRGISGRQRIARHLWRMCFALFIASGSLFAGQPQVFPESLRGSALLNAPVLAPLVLLIFWLLVVRLTKRFKSEANA